MNKTNIVLLVLVIVLFITGLIINRNTSPIKKAVAFGNVNNTIQVKQDIKSAIDQYYNYTASNQTEIMYDNLVDKTSIDKKQFLDFYKVYSQASLEPSIKTIQYNGKNYDCYLEIYENVIDEKYETHKAIFTISIDQVNKTFRIISDGFALKRGW